MDSIATFENNKTKTLCSVKSTQSGMQDSGRTWIWHYYQPEYKKTQYYEVEMPLPVDSSAVI